MLENYYDINKKDKFEDKFEDLYIGENPTKNKNKFLVWKISFAGMDVGHGEEEFRKSFNTKVILAARKFISRYSNLLGNISMSNEIDSAELVVQYISLLASQIDKAICVLIDEYDNFANELITGGKKILMKVYFMERALLKYFIKP